MTIVTEAVRTRSLKNEVGDWVAVPMPGVEGGYKAAKVVEADRERIVVELRFRRGAIAREVHAEPLPRIEWSGPRGRRRWRFK